MPILKANYAIVQRNSYVTVDADDWIAFGECH